MSKRTNHRLALVSVMGMLVLALPGMVPRQLAVRPRLASLPVLPANLPSHFSFGIMDGRGGTSYLDGMRTNNGTAWDFRYAYLAGGTNTGHGWATWNAPAGQYAVSFMQDDQANGYRTAFVYYMMLQSNGPSGSGEAATDLAHLDDPGLMSAYFADWALLMQKIGADGAPVLIVVEPDLWGYIEQAAVRSGSNSAASIPASVASSGYADAQGLPNTAQGFAWALLHIRDRYAPNALLALHASSWGTLQDIASNTSPSLDVTALGTQEGQFLQTAGLAGNPAGISTFDLVSNDIADHDSGQSGIWWDKDNVTYPNFARYLLYIHALVLAAGRRVMMWQVPAGNQYFDTENNSQGHTQDNRAEYLLAHIPDFADAGIIGVLFGPGNGGTNVFDNQGDGITNPAPISTYECDRCNDHVSAYPDDDGGYLRLALGQYDKNGAYPLSGGTFTPPSVSAATNAPKPAATHAPASIASSTRSSASAGQARLTSPIWLLGISLLLLITGFGLGGYLWWQRRTASPTRALFPGRRGVGVTSRRTKPLAQADTWTDVDDWGSDEIWPGEPREWDAPSTRPLLPRPPRPWNTRR
jgi:hypothetical protein